jgi:hypothetical protein
MVDSLNLCVRLYKSARYKLQSFFTKISMAVEGISDVGLVTLDPCRPVIANRAKEESEDLVDGAMFKLFRTDILESPSSWFSSKGVAWTSRSCVISAGSKSSSIDSSTS